ncbi:hypothetical protein LCGC14_1498150 [marine sediment metagenome]|uniref:Uncharacterized protein n=1 Tax=marine sediment metagenome TaxID=412755 RepID=A0A0F9LKK3_9ZZZZ
MAIDTLPLFVTDTGGTPDLDELKARMRLSGIVVDSNAEQIVHSVLMGVRAKFYGRLGLNRVGAVLASDPVVAPSTAEQIIRSIAYECEVLWVIVDLMCRLPMVFMDNSSGIDEIYNNEGAFRSMDADTLAQCKTDFEAQIADWLDIISGDVELGALGGPLKGKAYTQISQDPKLYPAGSLRSDNFILFTNPAAARALGLTT